QPTNGGRAAEDRSSLGRPGGGVTWGPPNQMLVRHDDSSVLHVNLTDESRGLIAAEQIRRMSRGALLINTARSRRRERGPCRGLCAGGTGVPIAWGLRGAMWFVVKRLSLGMLLIAAGSGVLLLTDVRPPVADGRPRPRIAILQQASTPMLDEGV